MGLIVCYSTRTNVTCGAVAAAHCTLFRHHDTVERRLTRLLLRCGPLRYRPSAVQSTIFCCQANKWLVSAAVSVYWLLILSLSRGWRGAFAFSGALLSDWQSPDFIDFFLHCSLSKYPTADLKDLRHRSTSAATHGSSYNGRLLHFVFSFFFF